MTLVTGLIGIAMLVAFLGIMLWWIKEVPLIIIIGGVIGLLVYDFVKELRSGNGTK